MGCFSTWWRAERKNQRHFHSAPPQSWTWDRMVLQAGYLDREPPERLFCLLFNNPRVVNTWQVILPLIHALKFQVTEVRWFLGDTPDWPSQHGPNLLRWLFYRAPFLTSFAKVNIVQNQKFRKRKSGWLGWLLWFVSSLQSNPAKPDFKAAANLIFYSHHKRCFCKNKPW